MAWGDTHVPYQHAPYVDAALETCRGADTIVHLGDLCDFYSLSRYNPDPRRKEDLQQELDEAREILTRLREQNPTADIHLVTGNHEQRLMTYLRSRAPALECLRALSLTELLGLYDLRIKLQPRRGIVIDGRLYKHGDYVAAKAGMTAHKEAAKHWCSGVSGHVHRLAKVPYTKNGVTLDWCEAGHTGTPTPDYLTDPDWQPGAVLVEAGKSRCIEF